MGGGAAAGLGGGSSGRSCWGRGSSSGGVAFNGACGVSNRATPSCSECKASAPKKGITSEQRDGAAAVTHTSVRMRACGPPREALWERRAARHTPCLVLALPWPSTRDCSDECSLWFAMPDGRLRDVPRIDGIAVASDTERAHAASSCMPRRGCSLDIFFAYAWHSVSRVGLMTLSFSLVSVVTRMRLCACLRSLRRGVCSVSSITST
jgi:hypothetical protein